jgi:hypothetical protein
MLVRVHMVTTTVRREVHISHRATIGVEFPCLSIGFPCSLACPLSKLRVPRVSVGNRVSMLVSRKRSVWPICSRFPPCRLRVAGDLAVLRVPLEPSVWTRSFHRLDFADTSPPCGKEGIGRESVVRRLAFRVRFEGWRALDPDVDLPGQFESPDASFGAIGRARRRDPRDEQARQEAEDRKEGPAASHAYQSFSETRLRRSDARIAALRATSG